jgi:hypothetical protein
MAVDRRDFLRKVAMVGGMMAIDPLHWLRLLHLDHQDQLVAKLLEWDLSAQAAGLVTTPGTLLAPATTANIVLQTVQGGDGSWVVSDDTSATWLRPAGTTNVLKVDAIGQSLSSDYFIRLSIPTPKTGAQIRSIHCAVYRNPGPTSGTTSVSYRLLDAGLTNGWRYDFVLPTITQQPRIGVYLDRLKTNSNSASGSPGDATSFTVVNLYLNVSRPQTLYLGPVYINYVTQPQVVITSDDGFLTDYTHSFVYIQGQQLGLVGSLAINSSFVNSNQRAQTQHLLEMQHEGWSMHNHTTTHVNLADTAISAATRVAAITDCTAWLVSNGLNSGSNALILPFGNNTGGAEDIVAAAGYAHWALAALGATSTWDGLADPHLIPRYLLDGTVSFTTFQTDLLAAIALGQSTVLYWHDPGGISNIPVVLMQSVCDYLAALQRAGTIRIVNLQQFVAGCQ